MTLQERVTSQLADLDSQIEGEKRRSAEKIASLLNRRAVIAQSARLISPDLEKAVAALQKIGILNEL